MNSRQRDALRLQVYYYRGLDVALSLGLTLFWATKDAGLLGLGSLPLSQALPYGLGLFLALSFVRKLDLYSFNRTRSVIHHAALMVGSVLIGLVPAMVLQQVLASDQLGQLMQWAMLLAFLMGGLHIVWAGAINSGRLNGALVPNIVLVGATRDAQRLIQRAHIKRDMNIIAVFDDRLSRAPSKLEGVPVMGRIEELINSHALPFIDTIAIAISPEATDRVREISQELSILPNRVITIITDGADIDEASLQRLARTPVAMLNRNNDADLNAFYKRLQDIVLSGVGLLVLAPLLMVVAALIKLDSPGPAFFRQKRHGFNQEIITVWKFRTLHHHMADATASQQVTVDDDRVTRIGRFLRATSIDELPQLINVLMGEMSLVGPRPHAIGMKTGRVESSSIVSEYAHRHRIKPGLTGWAAIKGSRGPLHTASDVRRRILLDVEYIERQSFWLDVWIIMKTVPVLLGDRLASR